MNHRIVSFLLLALMSIVFVAGVVQGQEGTPRITVTGATAARDIGIQQPTFSDLHVQTASRILLTGVVSNRHTSLTYPLELYDLLLDIYLQRIIVQGATANRILALERPPFLFVTTNSDVDATETAVTATSTHIVSPTYTSPPTHTPEVIQIETATIEPVTATTTPEDIVESTSEDESIITEVIPSSTITSLEGLSTPQELASATPSSPALPTAVPTPSRSPDLTAEWLGVIGVIVAAIIGAVATLLGAYYSAKKGKG